MYLKICPEYINVLLTISKGIIRYDPSAERRSNALRAGGKNIVGFADK